MKRCVLFMLISCSFLYSNAQDRVQRLITEIKASKTIECYYRGQAARPSLLFMQADTLNKMLSLNEKLQLANDSSYVLRYYCFHHLLSDTDNDSIVFELLKQAINDTTEVEYFCICLINTYAFNALLVEKYHDFIQAKYRDGNPTVLGDDRKVYMFPKPNKKKYKEKLFQLKLLIEQSTYRDILVRYIHE